MLKELGAAFLFFTRLPLWRLKMFNIPAEYFKQVINYWPVAGWLTSSVMAGMLWLSALVLPLPIAIIVAIVSRIIVTGGLHEDGLADFFDGFGGGNTRDQILAIMKDSHIGTYGVLSLIIYYLLLFNLLLVLSLPLACIIILVADPFSKLICSLMTLFLPYARTADTSKSKVVYSKMSAKPFIVSTVFGLLPFILLLKIHFWAVALFPIFVFGMLVLIMKKKIQGYTGDCCGASFLLCELSFYIGMVILIRI